MKKLLLSIALVLGMNSIAQAQTKKFEHNIYWSVGLVTETSHYGSTNGYSFRTGYGLNCYFSEKFSLMPCITLRQEIETLSFNEDGADPFCYTFVDVPVMAQFHLPAGKCKWVFGVGPMFSYCIGKRFVLYRCRPRSLAKRQRKAQRFLRRSAAKHHVRVLENAHWC